MSQQTPPPPLPIADLNHPILKAASIIAAGQLGLFKALVDGPRSIPEIANTIRASETGVARLVEALASVGYLERVDDRYANGPTPCAWLTPASPVDFTPQLLWWMDTWRVFGDLSLLIQRGGPERNMWQQMEDRPEVGRYFAQFMKTTAQFMAEPITKAAVLPDSARWLLDLGGSHGLYSIAFCKCHPDLKAVVFDLPVSLAETEENIAAEGLADRVKVQRGDFLTGDIGRGYDVILLFLINHDFAEEENRHLLAKVAEALNPGGLVMMHEFLGKEPPEIFDALFSLLLFTSGGIRCYTYQEITGWLSEVGFGDFKRNDLPPAGESSLITAVKTG